MSIPRDARLGLFFMRRDRDIYCTVRSLYIFNAITILLSSCLNAALSHVDETEYAYRSAERLSRPNILDLTSSP